MPAGAASIDVWWTVPAFRACAAHTRTVEFAAALDEVMAEAGSARVALMCAESVWWRCHRRIISDYLIAAGETVFHILGPNQIVPAHITSAAEGQSDGTLAYPAT